jgi:hypothetical protein
MRIHLTGEDSMVSDNSNARRKVPDQAKSNYHGSSLVRGYKRLKRNEGRLEKETCACGSYDLEYNDVPSSCYIQIDINTVTKSL